jgi:hypothetical protein
MSHSKLTLPALVVGLALVALPVAEAGADSPAAPDAKQPVDAAQTAPAQKSIDRYTATTTAMTPKDVTLRVNLLRWSDTAGRADVVAALGDSDPPAALLALPTLGHIWLSSSPVGFAVKYAHRSATPNGERVTFVTERRLDHYDFKKWAPSPPFAAKDTGYGVVELYLDANGQGTGTFSLVADVSVDEANALVSIADGAPRLLTNARVEPKPYWERAGGSSSN